MKSVSEKIQESKQYRLRMHYMKQYSEKRQHEFIKQFLNLLGGLKNTDNQNWNNMLG